MGAEIYIFIVMGLVLMGFAYTVYLRDKYQKAVVGHAYVSFYTKTGSRVDCLCPVDGDAIIPPAGLLGSNPKPITYFLRNDMTFNFSYPPHYPSFIQATVDSIAFGEGNPEPLNPFDKKPVVTDRLISTFRNEGTAALMMRSVIESLRTDDIMEALRTAGGGNKTLLYISIGLIAGLGILGFLLFKLSAQVGDLLALYGL